MENKPHDLKERTKAYARRIIHLYTSLSNETVAQVLGKQMLRSGTSVGANYREANRGRSKAEFISKMGDSLRELEETEYWIELLIDEGIVRPAKTAPLLEETSELKAIFITIINKSRGNRP